MDQRGIASSKRLPDGSTPSMIAGRRLATLLGLMIPMAVSVVVMIPEQRLRHKGWGDYPKPSHHPCSPLSIDTVAARATSAMHSNMHVPTAEGNGMARGAGPREVNSLAVALEIDRDCLAAHHRAHSHITTHWLQIPTSTMSWLLGSSE